MKKTACFMLLFFWLFSPALAQDVSVEEIVVAQAVEQLTPIGVQATFPADVGKLYCFSKISGATSETTITHVWYWKDQEMARVELPVQSASWRTYSSKNILDHWEGPWRVEIFHGGTYLSGVDFTVE